MSAIDRPLTPELVDCDFPLQEPRGVASHIKALLQSGDSEGAELLFVNLHAIDQGTVELEADELLRVHSLPVNLDVLRALRLGLQQGIRMGRQEGANVVKTIMTERGEQ